jgi:hypothetical protein
MSRSLIIKYTPAYGWFARLCGTHTILAARPTLTELLDTLAEAFSR